MRLEYSLRSVRILWSVTALVTAFPAWGHGWVTSPPSRQDHCAASRTTFDCGDIKYEPQSVEAPKGASQCSGGSQYKVLDGAGPWPVTEIASRTSFTWQMTAPHRTHSWEYFLDGTMIQYVDGGNQVPSHVVSHTLTGLPAGRHVILARWNVSDTPMAFYSCVDVLVGD